MLGENLGNVHISRIFDLAVGVNEGDSQAPREPAANRRFAGPHHPDQHYGASAECADDGGLHAVFRRFLNDHAGHATVPN
jgi:hypothetical protein